ncbi:hypothetical protein Tco_0674830 [Tanacetum coccineum]
METKDALSSCSDLDEQEIQQLQKQAKILKEKSLNKLNALQTTIQHLSSSNYSMYYEFRDAFHRLFEADERTFKSVLSRNMQNLERQLDKETLHEKDSNSDLNFKDYTQMEPQTFKEAIIQNMDSIEQCIVERAHHEKELQNRLKRLSERKLQIQECKIQKNQRNTSGDESSRSRNECNDKSTSGDDTYIRPSYEKEPMVEVDSNVILDSPDMCNNEIQTDQNVVECDDEPVALATLIENLKLDVDENKKIQKKLKK